MVLSFAGINYLKTTALASNATLLRDQSLAKNPFFGEILEEKLFPYPAMRERGREMLGSMVDAIDDFLTDKHHQKARYLPSLAGGAMIAAFCPTESGAGADAASVRTKAVRSGDGSWTQSGEKIWITNGGTAQIYTRFPRTDTPEGRMTPLSSKQQCPVSVTTRTKTRWASALHRLRPCPSPAALHCRETGTSRAVPVGPQPLCMIPRWQRQDLALTGRWAR